MIPSIYQVAMNDLDTPSNLTADAFCDLYERVTGRYDHFVDQSDLVVELSQCVWDAMSVPGESLRRQIGDWFDRFVTVCGMRVDAFVWTLQSVFPGPVTEVDVVPSLAGNLQTTLGAMLPTWDDWTEFQLQVMADPCPARLRHWLGRRVYGRPLGEKEKPHVRVLSLMCLRFGVQPVRMDGQPISYERTSSDVQMKGVSK
jgi:hypothetical protein